jgi:hypothetical protein
MHYHVVAGLRGIRIPSSSFKFKDRMEGISTFIEMAKVIWADQEIPPAHEQIKLNEKISMIRMQDAKNRLAFLYCSNECDDDNNLEFKLEL